MPSRVSGSRLKLERILQAGEKTDTVVAAKRETIASVIQARDPGLVKYLYKQTIKSLELTIFN